MNAFIFSSVIIFILVVQAVSNKNFFRQHVDARLVGGEEAVPHSFPFQVALFSNGYLCGGSLINEKWVLTSASCDLGQSPKVVLGAHRVQEQENTQVILTARRVINHEEFDQKDSYKNDIALVELPEGVILNENVRTVALPPRTAGAFIGELAFVSGWGSGNLYNMTLAPALRYFNATVISNVACQNVYGVGTTVYMSKLCLEGSPGSTCYGDYGGPLVIKDEDGNPLQIGISTLPGLVGNCHALYPPAFTRVSSFIDWIEKNTGLVLQ